MLKIPASLRTAPFRRMRLIIFGDRHALAAKRELEQPYAEDLDAKCVVERQVDAHRPERELELERGKLRRV
jgi:hypothetical protein